MVDVVLHLPPRKQNQELCSDSKTTTNKKGEIPPVRQNLGGMLEILVFAHFHMHYAELKNAVKDYFSYLPK